MKTFSQIIAEVKLHPDALHVKHVKVDGKTQYKVHAVGSNFSDGIKVGEHLTDTHLDDASEMGAKIKHIKEGKMGAKKKMNADDKHVAQQETIKRGKIDSVAEARQRFEEALERHGYNVAELTASWNTKIEEGLHPGVTAFATSKATRKVSTDQDTDIIRDYDADEPKTQKKLETSVSPSKYHHRKMKQFRTYKEEVEQAEETVDEAISSRQALSKAADFEYKAANSNDPNTADDLKGKAKALRRAAAMAARVAGTVDLDITKK